MQNPQCVTLIIAAYNAEKTITRAIRSALAEPEVTEVMVVDDASTDGTVSAAKNADDGSGRLHVHIQKKNAGPSAARNYAIRESRSPWIGILDADDFLLPGRTAGLLQFAADVDFIADDLWQVPETAIDGPRRSLLGEDLKEPQPVTFKKFVLANVTQQGRKRGELGFIKPLMRRSFLDTHHIRYQELMRLGEDYELYARALALGARMVLIPAQGYISVARSDSLSARHTETDLFNLRECDQALQKISALSKEDHAALRQHYLSIDCRLQWRLLILAVKKRDIKAALFTFIRPWPVPLSNLKELFTQFYLRCLRRKPSGREIT